jgi:hypothetical protein
MTTRKELTSGRNNAEQKILKEYSQLPVLSENSIDPTSYLIVPDIVGYKDLFNKVLFSYQALAILDPDWMPEYDTNNPDNLKTLKQLNPEKLVNYCVFQSHPLSLIFRDPKPEYLIIQSPYDKRDLEARSFELLSEDYPNLCIWRGGDFGKEKTDYAFKIQTAISFLFSEYLSSNRKFPTLIGIPLRELVQSYKRGHIIMGGDIFGPGYIRPVPYLQPRYNPNSEFHRLMYRPPIFDTDKERSDWIYKYINLLLSNNSDTHLDQIYHNACCKMNIERTDE